MRRGPVFMLAVTAAGAIAASVLLEQTELPNVFLGAKARRRLRRYLGEHWPEERCVFRVSHKAPPEYTAIDDDTRLVIQHLNAASAAA